ncbi:hypothetical protein EJB05_47261, partial [Eragrostis curvula]
MNRILQRSLAACRRFCRVFSATAGSPLPSSSKLLPHSVRGIFNNYCDQGRPHFFARPRGSGPSIDGTFSSMPDNEYEQWDTILDHCNGLLLFDNGIFGDTIYVCNPATRRWALLPSDPSLGYSLAYLAFDPRVSLHYKVFSSATGEWEHRVFVRQGSPACVVADVRSDSLEPVYWGPERRYAECWRGSLYVHCRGAYVMRLSLTEDKYRVIRTPTNIEENEDIAPFLGLSVNGVHYAALKLRGHELRIWALDDSGEETRWVLKHHVNLETLCGQILRKFSDETKSPWAIINRDGYKAYDEVVGQDEVYEWNSDDDDVIDTKESNLDSGHRKFNFIGFHPYKEVVFLSKGFDMVAYHLRSKKAQNLGNAFPLGYGGHCASFEESFIYTPCLIDSVPQKDL